VAIFDPLPTQADIPSHILNIAGRSLLFLFLGAGVMERYSGMSLPMAWTPVSNVFRLPLIDGAMGFLKYIEEDTGDEITQLGQRLNSMAQTAPELTAQATGDGHL